MLQHCIERRLAWQRHYSKWKMMYFKVISWLAIYGQNGMVLNCFISCDVEIVDGGVVG